jgi:hypothetical protein
MQSLLRSTQITCEARHVGLNDARAPAVVDLLRLMMPVEQITSHLERAIRGGCATSVRGTPATLLSRCSHDLYQTAKAVKTGLHCSKVGTGTNLLRT